MIKILEDFDEELEKHPWLPYLREPPEEFKHNCETYREMWAGRLRCKCTVCGLEFFRPKPNLQKCPFEEHHRPKEDVKERAARRMLS